MRTSMHINNKLTMLSEMKNDSKFQVLEYDNLRGAIDVETAVRLNIMEKAAIKLRQVRIILDDSSIKIEPGALSYMKGDIDIQTKIGGVRGLGKRFITGKLTSEEIFKPMYTGTGEVFLEPSFGHYALIELEDEEIIVDEGLFYACEGEIEVCPVGKKEGAIKTSIKGSGIVVLEIPVPEEEVFKCKLFNDTLKVDGNLVVLRTSNVKFSVEKIESVLGGSANGESMLNVYSGVGEVWLLPTQSIYSDLKNEDLNILGDKR